MFCVIMILAGSTYMYMYIIMYIMVQLCFLFNSLYILRKAFAVMFQCAKSSGRKMEHRSHCFTWITKLGRMHVCQSNMKVNSCLFKYYTSQITNQIYSTIVALLQLKLFNSNLELMKLYFTLFLKVVIYYASEILFLFNRLDPFVCTVGLLLPLFMMI